MFDNIVLDVILGLLFISVATSASSFSFWLGLQVNFNKKKNQ